MDKTYSILSPDLDMRRQESYAMQFDFHVPEALLDIDYEKLKSLPRFQNDGERQVLAEIPEGDDPYMQVFPVGLEFVHRAEEPLVQWFWEQLEGLGLHGPKQKVSLAYAPKSVPRHIDNNTGCVVAVPLHNYEHAAVWFKDRGLKLKATFKMQPGKAYILNVTQYHGLLHGKREVDYWFIRSGFLTFSYEAALKKIRNHVVLESVPWELPY